jgi:cardiolipin-specific phospholipase
MWPFSSSISVDNVKAEMEHAEDRLLKLAKRFVLPSQQSSALEITLHDTPIPKTSVPHIREAKSCFASACSSASDDSKSYTIHSVQITANDNRSPTKTAPLVLLHGYMNASSYFYRNFGGLANYFSTVHSLDWFGWGISSRPPWPKNLTTQQAEDILVESLEAWRVAQDNMPKMILAGHSMGGYVGVAYAERYPQHVERLVLLSPAGVPEETTEMVRQRKEQLASRPWTMRLLFYAAQRLFEAQYTPGSILRTLSTSRGYGWVSNYVEKRLPAISDPEERKAVSDYLYWNSIMPSSSEHSLSQILKPNAMGRVPLVNRVPLLKVPHVTFLYGSHDWMDVEGGLQVQAAAQQQVKQQLDGPAPPKVEVYRVDQAGHLLMLDNWREFNQGVILGAGGQPTDPAHVPTKLDVSTLREEGQPVRSYNEMNRMTRRPTGMASA